MDKKQIVDSPSANRQDFNPQTNEVIETRSTVDTAPLDDDLSSECNVDYTKLRNLLKAEQWFEADEETLVLLLKASGGKKELNIESIENLRCTDLRTIDQLWVKYSSGRFGFSVQKRIWESVGQDYEKFGDRVGWRNSSEKWLEDLSFLTFDLKAPSGHLPCSAVWAMARTMSITERAWRSFFSRVETCKVSMSYGYFLANSRFNSLYFCASSF
ncbi:hypothetical protein NUACC21_45630 [Scytonema sp. NUACC21]